MTDGLMTESSRPLTMHSIEAMDHDAFVETFGGLFEHSPWVAEAAWPQRPFATADALHAAMMDAVRAAPEAQQIALLCMHPELAGREAQAGTMTGHSTFEQRGAGLDALTRAELAELQQLNACYVERHGFPFIIAVLGHDKAGIFDALRSRVDNDTPGETAAALAQIARITRRRLDALFGANPSDSQQGHA